MGKRPGLKTMFMLRMFTMAAIAAVCHSTDPERFGSPQPWWIMSQGFRCKYPISTIVPQEPRWERAVWYRHHRGKTKRCVGWWLNMRENHPDANTELSQS